MTTPGEKKPSFISKVAFYYVLVFGCLVIGFGICYLQLPPYQAIDSGFKELQAFFKGAPEEDKSSFDRLFLHRMEIKAEHFEGGFHQRDTSFTDPGYVLVSEYNKESDQVIVRLVKIDGWEELHRWVPPIPKILDATRSDNYYNNQTGYRALHPLLHSDGSIVFTSAEGPMVKIDVNSEIVWTINEHLHHSIEIDHNGNYVVPIIIRPSFSPDDGIHRDDGYAIISPDGEILETRSIAKRIYEDERFVATFLAVGLFNADRIHLNDAHPVLENNGVAKQGDIMFSMRHNSMAMLYRPSEDRIVWGKTGPWMFNHDINILPDGRYSIFSNNTYQRLNENFMRPYRPHIDVYLYDAETDTVESPYRKVLAENKVITASNGRSRVLPNGDVFVEQTNFCRLLRLSKEGIRWEYVNQATDTTHGLLNWCRYYLPEEVDLGWLQQ